MAWFVDRNRRVFWQDIPKEHTYAEYILPLAPDDHGVERFYQIRFFSDRRQFVFWHSLALDPWEAGEVLMQSLFRESGKIRVI